MTADLSAGRRLPFAIAAAAACAGASFTLATTLAAAPTLILVLNACAVTMTIGVLWLYAPTAVAAILRGQPSGRDWLVVGSLALAAAFLGSRLVSIAARDFGLAWIIDSDLLALRVGLSLFGMLCLLVAPFAGEATFGRRWRAVAIWVAAGLVLAGLLVGMHRGHPPPLLPPPGQGRG